MTGGPWQKDHDRRTAAGRPWQEDTTAPPWRPNRTPWQDTMTGGPGGRSAPHLGAGRLMTGGQVSGQGRPSPGRPARSWHSICLPAGRAAERPSGRAGTCAAPWPNGTGRGGPCRRAQATAQRTERAARTRPSRPCARPQDHRPALRRGAARGARRTRRRTGGGWWRRARESGAWARVSGTARARTDKTRADTRRRIAQSLVARRAGPQAAALPGARACRRVHRGPRTGRKRDCLRAGGMQGAPAASPTGELARTRNAAGPQSARPSAASDSSAHPGPVPAAARVCGEASEKGDTARRVSAGKQAGRGDTARRRQHAPRRPHKRSPAGDPGRAAAPGGLLGLQKLQHPSIPLLPIRPPNRSPATVLSARRDF